ncbi:MAG: DNA repair protein RecO [Prolixibacteraceae bacterium]|nr:DNA repair protein RecO [Prolixibacteraceae bacterium]MBN2775465.1 DNA repair protein RecO [Prolixibacteraceae bacterium]
MLSQTKGIFLHGVKYGESSLIATIYTEKFGRQSYIINSVKGKKAGNKSSALQPLFLLDMIVYQKENREVQRMKEFKTYETFRSIPFDIKKSTQAIFIAEVLYKLLQEEESNPVLFSFFENAIKYLDLTGESIGNFHLFFLARLTEFVGIRPQFNSSVNNSFFDLKKGETSLSEPAHPFFMDKNETSLFFNLVEMKTEKLQEFKINREYRNRLLIKIIDYYRQHFDTLREIKSLAVLNEIFSL